MATDQPESSGKGPELKDEERKDKIFHQGILSDQGFDDNIPIWNLYVDGSSCATGCRAGIILNSLDGIDIEFALSF